MKCSVLGILGRNVLGKNANKKAIKESFWHRTLFGLVPSTR